MQSNLNIINGRFITLDGNDDNIATISKTESIENFLFTFDFPAWSYGEGCTVNSILDFEKE